MGNKSSTSKSNSIPKRKIVSECRKHPKGTGCGCFVDTKIFWLILSCDGQISIEKFYSDNTIKDLKLRFIQQFKLNNDILFDNSKYDCDIGGKYTSIYSDNQRIQNVYGIIYFPYQPIAVLYKSKNIAESIKNNQIVWQNKFNQFQIVLMNENRNINDAIVSAIIHFIIGVKSSNLPLPYNNDYYEYIYEYFVNDAILLNAMKCLGLLDNEKNKILNGKHTKDISCHDQNKLSQFAKQIKDERIKVNNGSVCQFCYVHDFTDGSGKVRIFVQKQDGSKTSKIRLYVDIVANVYQIKKLIEKKIDVSMDKNRYSLAFAAKLLEDHRCLSDYSIGRDSKLSLMLFNY